MYFAHIALAVICYVQFVRAGEENEGNTASNENLSGNDETANLIDNHTFVALVDIVFTDNSKKTCTGSIIHDNVVITAAHCFKSATPHSKVKPELTASFVVIGTKKMFDAGYEQYLPIERVLTHPKYKGWTADLSLVFTFAGMTSDKPGSIIPLAGDNTSTSMDSNVTVLSWGNVITLRITKPPWSRKQTSTESEESCDNSDSINESSKTEKPKRYKYKIKRMTSAHKDLRYFDEESPSVFSEEKIVTKRSKHEKSKTNSFQYDFDPTVAVRLTANEKKKRSTKRNSQYMRDVERLNAHHVNFKLNGRPYHMINQKTNKKKSGVVYEKWTLPFIKPIFTDTTTTNTLDSSPNGVIMFMTDNMIRRAISIHQQPQTFSFKSYYKNWRRHLGAQENKLTVENFVFLNIQTCKTIVEKTMPVEYDISKSNDVICYTSADRIIKDEDSGAPAIRNGELVAVTIGGAMCADDGAAIGMKISCYCSWIADNLPKGGEPLKLNCCKNCCDVKHKEENTNKQQRTQCRTENSDKHLTLPRLNCDFLK